MKKESKIKRSNKVRLSISKQKFSKKFWFYLIKMSKQYSVFGFDSRNGNRLKNMGLSTCIINGKRIDILYVFENDIDQAKIKLDKFKEYLEQKSLSKSEIMPIPEDWFFGNSIAYNMRLSRKFANTLHLGLLLKRRKNKIFIDIKKLKMEVNNKINQNKKWIRRFEKLRDFIIKYERKSDNKDLLAEIINQASCLDIFIADKIIKNRRNPHKAR